MKNFKLLVTALAISALTLCATNTYAQHCKDTEGNPRPAGIALTHDDEQGNHEVPTAAMSLPKFKGGSQALYRYIYKNMQYPQDLKSQNIAGQTQVKFTVNADSTISNVELFKTSGYEAMDNEAIRIVKSFPKWIPAKQECQCVPMSTVVTIPFDPERK